MEHTSGINQGRKSKKDVVLRSLVFKVWLSVHVFVGGEKEKRGSGHKW